MENGIEIVFRTKAFRFPCVVSRIRTSRLREIDTFFFTLYDYSYLALRFDDYLRAFL